MSIEVQAKERRQWEKLSLPLTPATRSWWSCYEFYFILLVAAFLRFYHIDRTEFNADQVDIFQMARDAVLHGHLVATSNTASIGIFNPPGIIYFLMLPASISANPLGGAIATAFLAVCGVLLTYILVQRSYGRVAATVSASLYAVGAAPLFYSRFMWNQNLLLFLTPLLFIFIFRGVVDRRKGWFAPALLLVGLLTQFHGSGFLLGAPLVAAVFLAPGTLRIRDFVLGIVALLFIYSTYILWLFNSHFRDIGVFLAATKHKAVIDGMAFVFYQQFLSPLGFDPYRAGPVYVHVWKFVDASWWLLLCTIFMLFLLICALVLLFYFAFLTRVSREGHNTSDIAKETLWRRIGAWWIDLRASPLRCGFVVLLVWQIVPLLYLAHHSLKIYIHYFILFAPGQFIVIGLLVAFIVNWSKLHVTLWSPWLLRTTIAMTTCIVVVQLVAGAFLVWDNTHGTFEVNYSINYDLASLQHAVAQTEELAQAHDAQGVYISVDRFDYSAMSYLAQQQQQSRPMAVFNAECVVLPAGQSRPSVYLLNPTDTTTEPILARFTHIVSITQIQRLAGLPFRLLLVQPFVQTSAPAIQGQNVALLSSQSLPASLLTRWRVNTSAPPVAQVAYTYQFGLIGSITQQSCRFESLRVGDQIVASLPSAAHAPLQVTYQVTRPYTIMTSILGLHLSFDTSDTTTSSTVLHTSAGSDLWRLPAL
jgi:hypothetical protein